MELREWLIILGLVLVTIIIVDGVRRLQRQRRGLRLDISRDIDPEDPPKDPEDIRREEQVSWELPNGGSRVVQPTRDEHDDDHYSRAGAGEDEAFEPADRRDPRWQAHNRRMEERWQARGESPARDERDAPRFRERDERDRGREEAWEFDDEPRGPRLAASRDDDDMVDPLDDPDSPPLTRDSRARRAPRDEPVAEPDDFRSERRDESFEYEDEYDDDRNEGPRRRPLAGLRDWAQSQIDALDQRRAQQSQQREDATRRRDAGREEKSERRQAPARQSGHERPRQDETPSAEQESPQWSFAHDDEARDLPQDDEPYGMEDDFEPPRGVARHPAVERARRHHVSPGRARNALADAEEVIVISVNARDEEGFNRPDLLQLVLACGLRYCEEMGVFHRFEAEAADSGLQFSMINSLKPGTFDLEDMDDGTLPSVTFLMPLPGAEDAPMAFEAMVETAMVLVRNLGGELKDENRSVMTAQTIEFARQRVRDFERRWRLHRQAH
ncbi:cell division protein ZipA [Kushneria sinocarnis]|uniref:Cell division protein ZipA n=1 Tax=Kushneria sinocarnis TaxID=595502 RepID=A0A420WZP5_9GAMM|nr:cell division protein ZipA C-terminal FtsZ-binding domain-containing protein [Kushneria sinocarnis]RKR06747.1 cell division protein ZipA [Kushneria sinocarnis]